MTQDKNLKNRAIMAYVHNMLIDAEKQRAEGKGTIVIEDESKKEYSLSKGLEIIKYCEDNGYTVDALEKLSFFNHSMLLRAKKYYSKIIDVYSKTFTNRHIPLLFSVIVVQKLEIQGYLKLDIDYIRIFNAIKESNHLERESKQSKFRNKEVVIDKEVNIYNECVDKLFAEVYKTKMSNRRKKK